MPSCHKNAAKIARRLSATDGLIASLTGSLLKFKLLSKLVVGICDRAGDMALLLLRVKLLSLRLSLGDNLSSLPPLPMLKWPFMVVAASGLV